MCIYNLLESVLIGVNISSPSSGSNGQRKTSVGRGLNNIAKSFLVLCIREMMIWGASGSQYTRIMHNQQIFYGQNHNIVYHRDFYLYENNTNNE